MGLEASCTARLGRRVSEGKALLENDALIFRGEFRLSIPLKNARSVTARDGDLKISWPEGTVILTLGPSAPKWADRILHPKSRVDKLGVKPDSIVSLIGAVEPALREELSACGAIVVAGRSRNDSDHVFLAVRRRADLSRLARLVSSLKDSGALWVIRPKGIAAVTQSDVLTAGRAAGLVDVKVISFSETHTAEKFVTPLSRRGPRKNTT